MELISKCFYDIGSKITWGDYNLELLFLTLILDSVILILILVSGTSVLDPTLVPTETNARSRLYYYVTLVAGLKL